MLLSQCLLNDMLTYCLGPFISLSHGLSIFQEGKSKVRNTPKLEAQAEMPKVGCLDLVVNE